MAQRKTAHYKRNGAVEQHIASNSGTNTSRSCCHHEQAGYEVVMERTEGALLGVGIHEFRDKQEMLSRILNEENRLIADSQVKDSDNDQEMLLVGNCIMHAILVSDFVFKFGL